MSNDQLTILYDENPEVTVEQLAENFGYEIAAVKMILSASSTRFRKEMRKNDDVFSDEEMEVAKACVMNLIRYGEVEAVKGRMAQWVINEKLGRNKMENAKNLGQNINVINIHVQKAREAIARSKEQKRQAVVDVEAERVAA